MKQFVISSADVKKAITLLGLVINEKALLPVTKNIHVAVGTDSLTLTTTNTENTISCVVPAAISGGSEYELLLPYDYFSDIIRLNPSCPITVEHTSTRKARIIGDGDDYKLDSLDKYEDFPKIQAVPKTFYHTLTSEFSTLLATAGITASSDQLRPAMTRVVLDINPEKSMIVSTDSHVMYTRSLIEVKGEKQQIQFSAKTIKAMSYLSEVRLHWNKKNICISDGTITIWQQLFEDRYPDYKAIIPSYPPNLKLNKQEFDRALDKCLISKISTRIFTMNLKQEEGKVHMVSEDPDYSRTGHVSIPGEYTGECEKILFSAKKMKAILSQASGEDIQLHIHSANKAALLSCESDSFHLALIMPVLI